MEVVSGPGSVPGSDTSLVGGSGGSSIGFGSSLGNGSRSFYSSFAGSGSGSGVLSAGSTGTGSGAIDQNRTVR